MVSTITGNWSPEPWCGCGYNRARRSNPNCDRSSPYCPCKWLLHPNFELALVYGTACFSTMDGVRRNQAIKIYANPASQQRKSNHQNVFLEQMTSGHIEHGGRPVLLSPCIVTGVVHAAVSWDDHDDACVKSIIAVCNELGRRRSGKKTNGSIKRFYISDPGDIPCIL